MDRKRGLLQILIEWRKEGNPFYRFLHNKSCLLTCTCVFAYWVALWTSTHTPLVILFFLDDVQVIPKLLKKQGYINACIGKYGVGKKQPDIDPIRKGFDYHYGYNLNGHAHNYFPPFLRENGLKVKLRNIPPKDDILQWEKGIGVADVKVDYSPDFIEARALEFIEDCKNTPFFLYYCPTMPHANNEGGETPDGMEVDTYGEFENV